MDSLPATSKPLEAALTGGKLRRVTLDEKAYRWLREALMAGSLQPGQVLTITGLAEQFDVSPMPVREALNRLVSEYALTLLPNRSLVVPALTPDTFREITAIRCRLESLAAAEATARMTRATLEEMTALNRQLEQDRTLDVVAFLTVNRRFHFALYEAAAMPVLLSLIEMQWARIGPLLRLVVRPDGDGRPLREHRALLKALKAGDAAAAADAIVQDLRHAADDILPRLQAE